MSIDITNTLRKKTVALGAASVIALAGALALGATNSASAAPIGSNALALKEAAPSNVEDVRRRGRGGWHRGHRGWRGHRGHRGWRGNHAVAGLALGIIGAGVASHYWGHYPYGYYPHHRYHYYGW